MKQNRLYVCLSVCLLVCRAIWLSVRHVWVGGEGGEGGGAAEGDQKLGQE